MKKDIITIFIVFLVAALLIKGTDFQSVEEYRLMHIDEINADSETIFISISCKSILDNYGKLDDNLKDEKYVPPNGVILTASEYVLHEGDTVFDILRRCCRSEGIQLEYQGADKNSFGSVYVQGINYLYEFSCGTKSGWMYLVNGSFPDYGCSDYVLSDGDSIEWIYTCNLGSDIGNLDFG